MSEQETKLNTLRKLHKDLNVLKGVWFNIHDLSKCSPRQRSYLKHNGNGTMLYYAFDKSLHYKTVITLNRDKTNPSVLRNEFVMDLLQAYINDNNAHCGMN